MRATAAQCAQAFAMVVVDWAADESEETADSFTMSGDGTNDVSIPAMHVRGGQWWELARRADPSVPRRARTGGEGLEVLMTASKWSEA